MGCGSTTVKIGSIIFYIFLALISVGGITLMALNPDYFQKELSIAYYVSLSVCVLFSFLGILAAMRESVCFTAICAVVFLALTIISIAIAVVGIKSDKHNGVDVVQIAWERNAMDDLQSQHDCCGKDSANDYVVMSRQIPASCYLNHDMLDVHNLFTEGCSGKMIKYYEEESYHFAIFSWLCVAIKFSGFLLAVFLVINLRNTQRRMQF